MHVSYLIGGDDTIVRGLNNLVNCLIVCITSGRSRRPHSCFGHQKKYSQAAGTVPEYKETPLFYTSHPSLPGNRLIEWEHLASSHVKNPGQPIHWKRQIGATSLRVNPLQGCANVRVFLVDLPAW